MGFGRGKRAGELREVEARLKEGSARADWVCNGGSAVGFELVGAQVGGGAVLGRGSTEKAKGGEEKLAGVEVVLVRARDEGGRLCNGRSTAASRWRPRGRLCARRGRVARQGEAQRDGKGGGEAPG